MPSIVVDSGPLIALFDGSDRHHARAVAFVRETRARLITNVAVLTEVARQICSHSVALTAPAELVVNRWGRIRPIHGVNARI